jgi:hypothetical protein
MTMPTINFKNATGTLTYEEAVTPPNPGPDPEPPDPPPSGDWSPPDYLRTDVKTEATDHTIPRPGYLKPWKDPVFDTMITRITGDPGSKIGSLGVTWPDVSRHHYNSDQAWNCNQTLIYLDQPGVFLDGESYQPKFMANGIPGDSDVRWHATDPALMLYAAGNKLGSWNPKTGANLVIKNFGSSYSDCKFGPWEGSPTRDGKSVVISCNKGAFAYNIQTGTKYPDIDLPYDNVRISPLGTYIIWGYSPDKVKVTTLEGAVVTQIADNIISHFDTTLDDAGDEVIVGRNNGAGGGTGGQLIKIRLRDGKRTELNKGGWCSHTSTRSLKTYAVSAPTDEAGGNPPYNGEVIMTALDGSTTWRLGHTHEPANYDYAGQTQPSHSPDAGRVIFASAWGGRGSPPRPVGCYVIDVRE